MRVLIVYHSETGRTEEVVRAIYDEASKGHEADLKKLVDVGVDELDDCDLVFLDSPCHSTDLAAPVKAMLESVPESPAYDLAGFFTHSTLRAEDDRFAMAAKLFERWAGKCLVSFEMTREKGVDFRGCYNCMGAPSPEIEAFIHRTIIPDDDEWKEYIDKARKHPTKMDLEMAREFAWDVLRTS
jgi:flavodoxin I